MYIREPPLLKFWQYTPAFFTCSVTGKTNIKFQHFQTNVTFYLLRVQYIAFHAFVRQL